MTDSSDDDRKRAVTMAERQTGEWRRGLAGTRDHARTTTDEK